METKKFAWNWQSVLLGMALCMALVVFVGSNGPARQNDTRPGAYQNEVRTGGYQKDVATNAILDKCELIDQRVLILEGKINHLQEQMDYLLKNMDKMWRDMDKKLEKK
jgi:hypothetical protein